MALIPVHCWNICTFYVINTQQMISNLAFLCNLYEIRKNKPNQENQNQIKNQTYTRKHNIPSILYLVLSLRNIITQKFKFVNT